MKFLSTGLALGASLGILLYREYAQHRAYAILKQQALLQRAMDAGESNEARKASASRYSPN